jgi:predicted DNA repair protein MutK
MPGFLKGLLVVGTAAMLWVGGSLIIHSLAQIGFAGPEHIIDEIAEGVAHALATAEGFVTWMVKAAIDGVLGLILGVILLPVVAFGLRVIGKGPAH